MIVVHAFTGLLLGAALAAQQTQPPQQPQGIGGAGLLQGAQQGLGVQGEEQQVDEFGSIWGTAQPHQFEGFPTFPSRLQGYGNYPLPVDPTVIDPDTGALTVPLPLPLTLPLPGGGAPAAQRRPDWPDWVHAQSRKPLPFAADQALLVRQVDRVWWRESVEEPFVPLYFHDKFATLGVGGEVEVRQVGRFELLLHESTRVETRGPTRLGVVALDEQRVELTLPHLTWLRLHVSSRVHDVHLPDGSTLHIDEASKDAAQPAAVNNPFAAFLQAQGGAAPPAAAVAQTAWVEVVRADEPGAYGGRATISNFGDRDVTWRHPFGEVVLHHGERVTLLLTPPGTPIGGGLQAEATEWQNDGGVVTCRAQNATAVGWCGARVTLPAGGSVRFESLQGDAFAKRGDEPKPGG